MTTHPVIDHAQKALAHPVSLAATLLLLLNALVFQVHWRSWWTGKLGDVAALVFVPFLIALVLGVRLHDERWAGWMAILLTGLAFGMAKAIPPLNGGIREFYLALTGVPLKLAPI